MPNNFENFEIPLERFHIEYGHGGAVARLLLAATISIAFFFDFRGAGARLAAVVHV